MSENIFKQLVVEVVTREPHPQGVWAVARVVEPNGDTYLFEATCGPNILKISGPNTRGSRRIKILCFARRHSVEDFQRKDA